MKTLAAFVFLVALPAAPLRAGEHPEHPQAKPKPSSPAPSPSAPVRIYDSPAQPSAGPSYRAPAGGMFRGWGAPPPSAGPEASGPEPIPAEEYSQAVQTYVDRMSPGGGVGVRDDKLGKDWNLRLEKVHEDRIVTLEDGTVFACADFEEADGPAKLDLDFYIRREDGSPKVAEILIHKVNGRARFNYDENNQRVPVKSPRKAPRTKTLKTP